MPTHTHNPRIYDGEGDRLMAKHLNEAIDSIMMLPDARPSKVPETKPRIRIMWGQHLLEDLLAGRYRSVVCAVNPDDNSHGLIAQLAALLPTSQWDAQSITARAKQFSHGGGAKILKYDMDAVEVLAVLRQPNHEHLTMDDLTHGFRVVAEMLRSRTERLPSASVSFLGARSNLLVDDHGEEPTFETVLRVMHEAGFAGDVYPAPAMWEASTGVYARYPFPASIEQMRQGGF